LPQPRIVDLAIGKQVGPHPAPDREQRQIGDPVARSLRAVGDRGKIEGGATDRSQIESERNRVACADNPALDSEPVAQPDIQSVGEHHEPRGNFLAVRQQQLLPLRARRNGYHLAEDRFDLGRNFGADGVDQCVVHDAVLPARPLVEQVAESRDPVLAVMGCGLKRRVGDAGLAKALDLLGTAQFFDAKIRRIDWMRVDQNR
jgi:hypothetical protein